jgi:hypothetical protein
MAAVNEAYEKGDFEAIQRVLADWEASPDIGTGDGVVAESECVNDFETAVFI